MADQPPTGASGATGPYGPGTILGGRFECHGVVGHGGTATVVLATDRLRNERVALKIVHPHLAADEPTRRRLQREVQTASLLRAPEALVPYDLHAFPEQGLFALSMPFHAGRTLTERVAEQGALPIDEARLLGIRIARALAEAHRAGVLHRDVTANNVLIGKGAADAVLTDFGLSRLVRDTRSTHSTGLLGTAGYAAPEVYAGDRADPRSDLYGLGAALYLAVTGKPAFDPNQPATAFKRQLDGTYTPVRELRPDCPPDLAATIDALLRPEPNDRPAVAGDVIDALQRGQPVETPAKPSNADPARTTGASTTVVDGAGLARGDHVVIVRERGEDQSRRQRARRRRRNAPPTAEDEVLRWGGHLVDRVRTVLGVPAAPATTPEEQLVAAVAEEAKLPADALVPSAVVFERSFRLVDGVDAATAERLATAARDLGFRGKAVKVVDAPDPMRLLWVMYGLMVAIGWATTPLTTRLFEGSAIFVLLFTVITPIVMSQIARARPNRSRESVERDPLAYRADLRGALRAGVTLPSAQPAQAQSAPAAAPAREPTRGEALLSRANGALDALEAAITSADLADLARSDLSATANGLRSEATALAIEIDEVERALAEPSVSDRDLATLQSRLGRLDTLAAAGDPVDPRERDRLVRAIDAHEASRAAGDQLEARAVSATARLIELTSTASRVRRELALEPDLARSADRLVERLRAESKAAHAARTEAATSARDRQRRAARSRELG